MLLFKNISIEIARTIAAYHHTSQSLPAIHYPLPSNLRRRSLATPKRMTGTTKRRWRWSSKSLLDPSASSKVRVIDHPDIGTQDGGTDAASTNRSSLGICSLAKPAVAARMRRNKSKLLSIVGLQRFGMTCRYFINER